MVKLLLGGSPCTHWSIAQKQNRETQPTGIGWELFENYLIAKEKFQPDFFLYENNVSASKAIKSEIKKSLGVCDNEAEYIEINSALVSAQNRQRFYVHNGNKVPPPEDRGILLTDILEPWTSEKQYELAPPRIGTPVNATKDGKSQTIKATYQNSSDINFLCYHSTYGATGIAEPIRIGTTESKTQTDFDSKPFRVYSPDAKSTTLMGQAGGVGAKTGLYAVPIGEKRNAPYPVYDVKDGLITIKGNTHPIDLPDGQYIIRQLTVKECCRLQTLPDDYCRVVSKRQAYKGLGNGWTAEVIIHILSYMLEGISKDEELVVLSMYDGIGTGRYCLNKMGFANINYYAFEIDKYAMAVAQSNFPNIVQCGDAYQARAENFLELIRN